MIRLALMALFLGALSAGAEDCPPGSVYGAPGLGIYIPCPTPPRVIDGDTIEVEGTKIRLNGLHCPEMNTDEGQWATAILKDAFELSERVTCQITGRKSYDREIGWCQLDGVDIGTIMIQSGHCQPCRRYDTTGLYSKFPVSGDVPGYCK